MGGAGGGAVIVNNNPPPEQLPVIFSVSPTNYGSDTPLEYINLYNDPATENYYGIWYHLYGENFRNNGAVWGFDEDEELLFSAFAGNIGKLAYFSSTHVAAMIWATPDSPVPDVGTHLYIRYSNEFVYDIDSVNVFSGINYSNRISISIGNL